MQHHIIEQTSHGNTVRYQRLPSGTCYHEDTPQEVIALLEEVQGTQRKIRLYYGDPATGQSWFDENDVIGTIGRSCGKIKVPLLIEPGESGGLAILDTVSCGLTVRFGPFISTRPFGLATLPSKKGSTSIIRGRSRSTAKSMPAL